MERKKGVDLKVLYDSQGVRNAVKEIVICAIVSQNYDTLAQRPTCLFMSNIIHRVHRLKHVQVLQPPPQVSQKLCAGSSMSSQMKLSGFMDGFLGKSLGINSVRAQNIILVPVILLCCFYHLLIVYLLSMEIKDSNTVLLVRLRHLSVVCNDVSYRVSYPGTCIEICIVS